MKLTDKQMKKVLTITEKCLLAKNKGYDVFLEWSPHCMVLAVCIHKGKWERGVEPIYQRYQYIKNKYPKTKPEYFYDNPLNNYSEVSYETEFEEMLDSLEEIKK